MSANYNYTCIIHTLTHTARHFLHSFRTSRPRARSRTLRSSLAGVQFAISLFPLCGAVGQEQPQVLGSTTTPACPADKIHFSIGFYTQSKLQHFWDRPHNWQCHLGIAAADRRKGQRHNTEHAAIPASTLCPDRSSVTASPHHSQSSPSSSTTATKVSPASHHPLSAPQLKGRS